MATNDSELTQIRKLLQATYSDSTGTQNVTESSPASLQTDNETLLDAATADGSSFVVAAEGYSTFIWQYVASGVSGGATLDIEISLDGTNWIKLHSFSISADGTDYYAYTGKLKEFRVTLTIGTAITLTAYSSMGKA